MKLETGNFICKRKLVLENLRRPLRWAIPESVKYGPGKFEGGSKHQFWEEIRISSFASFIRTLIGRVFSAKPALSVIITNYNNENYLGECLDSVLHQTYQDFEIVVCDDGSTDGSWFILQDYQRRIPGKIRLFKNKFNQGVTLSRHLAIKRARGRYLTTLDSDDLYASREKLEKEMRLVHRSVQEEGREVIAFSNIKTIKADGSEIAIWGNADNIREGSILKEIMTRSCMIPRDFIFSKAVYFDVGGFDTAIPLYEDWDLKIRLASRREFRYSDEMGTAYRRHGQGLSAAPLAQHIEWMWVIFKKNLELVESSEREDLTRQFDQFLENNYK